MILTYSLPSAPPFVTLYTFLSSHPFAHPIRQHPTPPKLFPPHSHSLTHQTGQTRCTLHIHSPAILDLSWYSYRL
ncbi:hypothetical protein BDP81DRAFT_416359 [Colletotrichum phormii]|uniref:Uncharacterized protein n=1 Tax=Colletotrichum phormii TaxID=359342 RepID=A0AAJ0A1J6_9PEZI|nr:uncharacterized protein BDP81DRAFT_416359 [Colletotrichum phormii]KAK1654711.1 hypothetical protein BDP81DRAFT_416359 [Colletotrichum phormii]